MNGLLGVDACADVALTFVVVDNDGGGIFEFLPPRDLAEFEALFATPQHADLVAIARAHGVAAERVDAVEALDALKDDVVGAGVRVVVIPVDRATTVARHRELWDAVAAALA